MLSKSHYDPIALVEKACPNCIRRKCMKGCWIYPYRMRFLLIKTLDMIANVFFGIEQRRFGVFY